MTSRFPLASIKTDECDARQNKTACLEKAQSSACLLLSPSHMQVLIDFIFKTIDSLSHLLCCGTCSEESANIWQV